MSFVILVNVSAKPSQNAPKCVVIDSFPAEIGRKCKYHMDTSVGKEISRHHATINTCVIGDSTQFFIEDQKSVNGTFVNGKKIDRKRLYDGDEIVFGGGAGYSTGDALLPKQVTECRYILCLPKPRIAFVKPDLENCEECSDKECCICYCPMKTCCKMPCGHRVCQKCMKEWIREGPKLRKKLVCPVCRAEFTHFDAFRDEIQYKHGNFEVEGLENFLAGFDLASVSDLKKLSIFNAWADNSYLEKFNECAKIASKSTPRLELFKFFVGATVERIIGATHAELVNAFKNLGGGLPSLTEEGLRSDVAWLALTKIDRICAKPALY